ncbi:MAG: Eco57I restriction-modification methylase domain-containing protein [Promethearchaeota archaeon]
MIKKEHEIDLKKISTAIQNLIFKQDIRNIFSYLNELDEIESNFLESYKNRKNEGVFFTNHEISEFLINRTLLIIINKFLENKRSLQPPLLENLDQVENLNDKTKVQLQDFLLHLTTCDPACGSGIFLLKLAESLFNIIVKLNPRVNREELKAKLLLNLHGLDINPFALNMTILKLIRWYYTGGDKNNCANLLSPLISHFQVANAMLTPNWRISLFNQRYFDLITCNPPYGNIIKNSLDKEILKSQNHFVQDVYCIFLMKALDWINNGIASFLIPKSFLLRQNYIHFRNLFLSQARLIELHDLGSKIFPRATNEVQILIFEKQGGKNSDFKTKIYDYPLKLLNVYSNGDYDFLNFCLNSDCELNSRRKKFHVYTPQPECPYCNSKTVPMNRIRIKMTPFISSIIKKIETLGDLNYLNLKDFPKLIRGEEDKGLKELKKYLKQNTEFSCYFIDAKQDFSYFHLDLNKSVDLNKIDPHLLKGDDFEFYLQPKLLIKHNNRFPETIYTERPTCFTSSIYSLLHEDRNELKFLCAVLNSGLIQFYCLYGINNQKNTTINLNQYMIRHLPIIRPDLNIKNALSSNVSSLLELHDKTKGKINSNIKKLIQENDDLIFKLYNLTDDEKKQIIIAITLHVEYFKQIYGEMIA